MYPSGRTPFEPTSVKVDVPYHSRRTDDVARDERESIEKERERSLQRLKTLKRLGQSVGITYSATPIIERQLREIETLQAKYDIGAKVRTALTRLVVRKTKREGSQLESNRS